MQNKVKRMCVTAVFMALTIVLSSFGMPVPGGHLYLNDIAIVTGALLMNPFEAFLIGGIGSFLGDLFFYPTPMFVSFVTHGLQAIVISYLSKKDTSNKTGVIAITLGAIIMVVGYTLGRAFIYSTIEAAILKLPYQILQAVVGAIVSYILIYKVKIQKVLHI